MIYIDIFITYILAITYHHNGINHWRDIEQHTIMPSHRLPKELVNIILKYDGRFKYRYKRGQWRAGTYSTAIHPHDARITMVSSIIDKKITIMKNTTTSPVDTSFYFEFGFDAHPGMTLCYDFGWNEKNVLEICFVNLTGGFLGSDQIRTYI